MYKYLAAELKDRQMDAGRQMYKTPTIPAEVREYEPPVDLDQLTDGLNLKILHGIFESVMRRREDKLDRSVPGSERLKRKRSPWKKRWPSWRSSWRATVRFPSVSCWTKQGSRVEIVVTFLAVLETDEDRTDPGQPGGDLRGYPDSGKSKEGVKADED